MHELAIVEELVEKIREYERENGLKAERIKIQLGRLNELTDESFTFLFKNLCPDIELEIEKCNKEGIYLKSIRCV